MKKITIVQLALIYIQLLSHVVVHTQPYNDQPWENNWDHQYNYNRYHDKSSYDWQQPTSSNIHQTNNDPSKFFRILNIPQMSVGITIGVVATLAWNYYEQTMHSSKNSKKHTSSHIDADTTYSKNRESKEDRSSPLTYKRRIEILEKALHEHDCNQLNIPLVACLTQGYSRIKLEKFLKILKKSALEYNIDFMLTQDTKTPFKKKYALDMHHVQMAIEEMMSGSPIPQELNSKKLLETAIHEAGHAVAVMRNEKFILNSISIIHRMESLGRIIQYYTEDEAWTINDVKDDIIVCLSGAAAEQVFGFDTSRYANRYPQARQQFDQCCVRAQNKNISQGLAEALRNPGAVGDMISAWRKAEYIVHRYQQLQSSQQTQHKKPGQLEDEICCILEECYQKAIQHVQAHKSIITQIAQLLMKHEIIAGDYVYSLCKIQRPLYECEKHHIH